MSTYEISKSSLLSLKAEILKKQEEVNKAKLENKSRIQREVKKGPLELKNKGIENRLKNDITEEDEELLRKSRAILEEKSKLYDKLSKGSKTEEERDRNRLYLVHFDKKSRQNKEKSVPIDFDDDEDDVDKYPESEEEQVNYDDYKAENSDDEWVEYTDCFGRTRSCLKKDLAFIKQKDSNLRNTVENRTTEQRKSPSPETTQESESNEINITEDSEMLSADMRRELQRQKWESEENELRNKTDVHYQDILFNEARTHGTAYYGFSKNEDERFRQQEALKNLRKETEEQQKLAQEVRKNREKQLKARVRAAQNRKRARMGLSPLKSDDEEEKVEEVAEKSSVKEKTEQELKDEREREKARQQHIRPWDIGKEGTKKHQEYTQEEWVAIQRKKRDNEFAPPRSYNSNEPREMPAEHEKGLYFSTARKKKPINDSYFVDTSRPPPDVRNPSKNRVNPYKSEENVSRERTKPFSPVPIEDESVSDDSSNVDDDRLLLDYKDIETRKRVGAEVPPPATFEYYGPSYSKRSRTGTEKSSMEDSIMEGLKFLREKVEKKKVPK